jgi:hypothetical protein
MTETAKTDREVTIAKISDGWHAYDTVLHRHVGRRYRHLSNAERNLDDLYARYRPEIVRFIFTGRTKAEARS